jgi:threonine aldolase
MRQVVDLRSDTVTKPTPEMIEAMSCAVCGDDVYGDDPTTNRLEALAAERLGKEAAMYVPSGTMGNLVAILTHCNRGDEMIVGEYAHIFYDEAGGSAAVGGVQPYPLRNSADGTIPLEEIETAIRPDDIHFARSRLICLENTQSECGGTPLTLEYTRAVADIAQRYGLKLHLDGARIFNAAVALGVPAKDLAEPADSVMFCISKGLCAPIGSILCGSADFIRQARRARKQLGGGMRQVGVIAAAGIVALEQMVDRLADDHRRAKTLAAGLVGVPGITVENANPPTNHVFIQVSPELSTAPKLLEALEKNGLLGLEETPTRVRFLTHYWIDDAAIQRAIEVFRQTVKELQAA